MQIDSIMASPQVEVLLASVRVLVDFNMDNVREDHGPMAAVSSRAATRKLSARTAVQATSVGSSLGSHVH